VFPRTELQMIFEIGKPENNGKEEI